MSLILSGTDGLSDIDGSAATPAIRGTDANTGIFFGTDIIGFSEGGVEAMRINASGNVEMTGTLTTVSRGIAKASMPAGSVLQVVSTTKTDTFQTTSATFVDLTGLSVSITPTSTSSKIWVIVNTFMGSSDTAGLAVFNLVRGSTNVSQPATTPTFNGTAGGFTSTADNILPVGFNFLDSPATTSATTYKIQCKMNSGTLSINRRNSADCAFTSTITAMEIAA